MTDQAFIKQIKEHGGTHCPCCGQFAKIYKRKLNTEIAYGVIRLLFLAKMNGDFDKFFHVSLIMRGYIVRTGGGDFAKAELWGLIEPMMNDDSSKRHSGMWRITSKGKAFAEGFTKMPSHVFIYDGKAQGFTVELVSIKEALQSKFDYSELMEEN